MYMFFLCLVVVIVVFEDEIKELLKSWARRINRDPPPPSPDR